MTFLERVSITPRERRSLFVRKLWRFNPHSHDHLPNDPTCQRCGIVYTREDGCPNCGRVNQPKTKPRFTL